MKTIACWIVSREGLLLAERIRTVLAHTPWIHGDAHHSSCDCYASARLAGVASMLPCKFSPSLATTMGRVFTTHAAHIILGAAGIAVRLIAPHICHKRLDPAVVVIDSAGRFVLSLLSGHIGGANSLTRHLADGLSACPVITTASDQKNLPALDTLLTSHGLLLRDWDHLPRLQGALLEMTPISLYDPYHVLPPTPGLIPSHTCPMASDDAPCITIDWRTQPSGKNRLRAQLPCVLGIGCKKNLPIKDLRAAVSSFFADNDLAWDAIAALATVATKADEDALRTLSHEEERPLLAFDAAKLARIPTPHPAPATTRVFGTPPFSVCEAAALLGAQERFGGAKLVVPKARYTRNCTLAVACAMAGPKTPCQTPSLSLA